jgi:hypothetical protein
LEKKKYTFSIGLLFSLVFSMVIPFITIETFRK